MNPDSSFDSTGFLDAVVSQDAAKMRRFLEPDAVITWPCTGETFTADEYVRVNCAYPGTWQGTVLETGEATPCGTSERLACYAAKVTDRQAGSFIVVGHAALSDAGRIRRLTEYWGDCQDAPQWRKEMIRLMRSGDN